jgi:hypothetical protein
MARFRVGGHASASPCGGEGRSAPAGSLLTKALGPRRPASRRSSECEAPIFAAAKDHIDAAIDKDGLAGHLAVRLTFGLQGADLRQMLASQGCCSRGTPSGRG